MCGAFSILHPFREGWDRFNAGYGELKLAPRYNARPGQELPVILNNEPDRFKLALWGFMPNWKDAKPIINARKESLDAKVTFEKYFRENRCLIPADGFYEWGVVEGKKQPFRFTLKTQDVFAFAGIWKLDPKTKQPEFAIITTEPNNLVKKIHNRMPTILPETFERAWIDSATPPHHLMDMLSPFPENLMESYPVSTLVNSAKNDSPELIKPLK